MYSCIYLIQIFFYWVETATSKTLGWSFLGLQLTAGIWKSVVRLEALKSPDSSLLVEKGYLCIYYAKSGNFD